MVRSEHPWTAGPLTITRATLGAVEADVRAGWAKDEEACGYLRGPAGTPLLVDEQVAMVNTANKLHALDPETYFRTGRMFFSFNEKKFDDAVQASVAAGRPVKVLYHSHLDAGAYFSATDKAVMSMGEPPATEGAPVVMGPGPAWPLAFLVTSIVAGEIGEHRLFVWSAQQRDFVTSELSIID